MKNSKRRYYLNQFSDGTNKITEYLNTQKITNEVFETSALQLSLYKIDFEHDFSLNERKEIISSWIKILPKLTNVKKLYVRYNVNQEFFDTICKMTNLEELYIRSSSVDNIKAISSLKKLKILV